METSKNPTRFPNAQHKLRYAYQFLTRKAQLTHLRQTADSYQGETWQVRFDTFATALDLPFGNPDEKHISNARLGSTTPQI